MFFFFSSRRRHTRCALVTGVQTCALPIYGVAIQPLGDTVVAPFDGEVVTLHDAGHAVSLRSAEGAEVLIHIGLDTVMLKGEGFTPLVAAGAKVDRKSVV